MSGGIYIIENLVTGDVYVGSAKSFQNRWKTHLTDLKKGVHVNIRLQRAYVKYGQDAFAFCEHMRLGEYSRDLYFKHENELMDQLRASGKRLYNIAKAEGGWSFHDAATKKAIGEKISASVKENVAAMTADERRSRFGHDWGDSYPIEARKKISQKLSGIKRSEQTKSKMKDAQLLRADEKREVMSKVGKLNKGRLPPNAKKVMLDDGSIFPSLAAAARHLKMSSSGLIKRFRKNELGRYI